jgi:hypothetical protein
MLQRYRTTAQRGAPVPQQKPILPDGRDMAMPIRRLRTVRRNAKTAVLSMVLALVGSLGVLVAAAAPTTIP